MTITEVFAGIAVADIGSAAGWHERLVGRSPDLVPNENGMAARGLGMVYVVGDAERAGRSLLTLLVEDLDAEIAALATRGVSAGPIDTISEQVRVAVIGDPDGNTISLGQPARVDP